jgi:hypothetical protein
VVSLKQDGSHHYRVLLEEQNSKQVLKILGYND